MASEKTNPRPELEERLRFETLIADLSSKFVNLPGGEVDREIADAERRICELLDIDLAALWQWLEEAPEVLTPTHVYTREGLQAPGQMRQEHFPWFLQEMLGGRLVALSSLMELPAEAAVDLENCRQIGVKSNLTIPLSVGGKPPIGILGFNTLRTQREWPEALVKRLQLVAQIFANALARRHADQALRQTEERMTLAAEAAALGVWGWDLARNHVWGSERWLRLFGFDSGNQLSFETILQRIHPEDRGTVEREVRQAVAKGSDYAGEFRVALPDGPYRWIASRGRGHADATGTPARMIGAATDITERKRAEEQVRQLSLAVEQSPASVVITDLQGQITYVNRKFCEVSGYSLADCLGQNPRILKSGECPASTYEELWRCITSGGTWRGEFHNRKKSGELYWEWAVISPLIDVSGNVTHFVGVKEDITERKRAEEAFRASQALLEAGADLAGLGCYEVDFAERSCIIDDRFHEICGVPAGRQAGLRPVELWMQQIHPEDRQRVLEQRDKLHDARLDRLSIEYRYLHPTQGEKWLHHSARVAVRDTTGHSVRSYGAVRDITAQKQAEQALHNSYAEIERLKDKLQAESDYLRAEVKVTQAHGEVIGKSAAIRKLLSQAEQVAPTDSSVLISGETGTGKELIAQTIHRLSSRSSRLMVKVNCAALPAALVESELFGREKGAFTGALMRQIGRFELADGSTIFLDEVGELSLEVQAKLLRVLQEGQFERLGNPKTIKVNVRLIGASNRDLHEEVRKGRFREDLFYRLNVFPLRVPPLRDRPDDIPALVWSFVEEFSSRMGKKITQVPRKTMEMLQRHPWPGNVRELRNVIEHSTIITTGDTLRVPMLEQAPPKALRVQTLADSEREQITQALEKTGWRIKGAKGAAAALGINPSTLYHHMSKLGIPTHRQKSDGLS